MLRAEYGKLQAIPFSKVDALLKLVHSADNAALLEMIQQKIKFISRLAVNEAARRGLKWKNPMKKRGEDMIQKGGIHIDIASHNPPIIPPIGAWNMYAGGTGAREGQHSFDVVLPFGRYMIDPRGYPNRGYHLYFVNDKGKIGGGLYHDLGTFSGLIQARNAAAKHAATLPNPWLRVRVPGFSVRRFRVKRTGRFGVGPGRRHNPKPFTDKRGVVYARLMDDLRRRHRMGDKTASLEIRKLEHAYYSGVFGNPLTAEEKRELDRLQVHFLRMAQRKIRSKDDTKTKRRISAAHYLGEAHGVQAAISRTGWRHGLAHRDFGIGAPGYPPLRTVRHMGPIAQKIGAKIFENPAGSKMIGRKVILIKTTHGEIKPAGPAALYGLKDGSIYIRGFFLRAPRGNVTRIEYTDEAKASREGLRNPALPWRHDFSSEHRPIKKVRGGLLIPRGKRPLWGMR
jgi:hypothetical protein